MIQRVLKPLLYSVALISSVLPSAAFAQIFKGGDTKKGVDDIRKALAGSGIEKNDSVIVLVIKFVNFALPFLALGSFVGFVYASFLYVTAFGNDDQVQKAKKVMIYVVVGIVVVILSYSIVTLFGQDLAKSI